MLTTKVKKPAGIRWQWTPAQEAALLAELEAEGVPGFGGCPLSIGILVVPVSADR
jgi:hypothetical protein